MEPIATTLLASNQSTVSFTGIPQTYKHLQLRYSCITNRATYGIDDLKLNLNSDTGANYSWHDVRGDGATAASSAGASASYIYLDAASGTSTTNAFGVGIVDFLDYANVYKFKTVRALTGVDLNGTVSAYGGRIELQSGLWMNTAGITSITFAPLNGTTFNTYSRFSLYGVKA